MTVGEFKQLVRDMRAAQREYFKTRTQAALVESKRLEAEVDRLLDKGPAAKVVQGALFDGAQTSAKPGHAN